MKISLNHIRYYRDLYEWSDDPAPEGADKLIEKIGAQLAGVEEVMYTGKKYDGAVIVRVVTCEQHPNADRLHVCTIDDGGITPDVKRDENGLVQVVCGAPNVAVGKTVVWLPPGATVPSTFASEPFVLEARELRGVISNGMLASPKELAIGDSHEGLLIIDEEVAPGTMFADKYNLRDDVIIDMENKMFTHRPDCFGMIGVAREIAGIQHQAFTSPEWYRTDAAIAVPSNDTLPLEIRNELPELVPRFMAVTMSDITVAPSPVWLQVELSRYGIRPINNVVDLTNYHMLLTGQPLHAYDYDKVKAQDEGADQAALVVRKPQDGEKLTLLSGKEITPRGEAILIASATKSIGLGGVMGGADTEVDDNTKNIILECANFDMYSIRKTAMAHGVFTDAVTRFNKGQSPLQNPAVLAKIVTDVIRICGGKVASSTVDDNHVSSEIQQRESLHPDITVAADFITDRLGLSLSASEMAELLTNVEFIVNVQGESLQVRAPFWRTDIEIAEDVVEEIGRLYGYDKLPLELPKRTNTPAPKDVPLEAKAQIREALSRAGANEVLTYSFVHGNLLERTGQDTKLAFKLSNALSPDLQYYRLSLTPNLLDKVHANIKAGYDEFALFEIGKVHGKADMDDEGLPRELGRVGFVFAAADRYAEQHYAGAPYYQAATYLDNLLPGSFTQYSFKPLAEMELDNYPMFAQLCAPYDAGRSAIVFADDHLIGVAGEYKASVQKALKLPKFCAGFELFLSYFENTNSRDGAYIPVPRFPKVTQDITLKLSAEVPYRQVYDAVWTHLGDKKTEDMLLSLMPLDIYQNPADKEFKHVTLRLNVASYEKTMTDAEVSAMLDEAARAAHEQLGAERV